MAQPKQDTQILALPLAHLSIQTGKNEDWIDTVLYVVGDVDGPQLDLRGIEFDMHVRRRPHDNEVLIHTTTKDGTLSIGSPPNVGYLIIHVPLAKMQYMFTGQYVGDIVARDDRFDRVCLTFDLTIIEGVTKKV